SFFKFLIREQLIDYNPILHVKAQKTPKRLPVTVGSAKLDNILDRDAIFPEGFSGLRDKLVIELLFGTGIRLAELISLKEKDIDHWNKTVRLLGKRGKERIVPLNSSLIRLLGEYTHAKHEVFGGAVPALILTDKGQPA